MLTTRTKIAVLYLKGLSHQQIAEVVGWKKTSIKSYLRNMRNNYEPATEAQIKFLDRLKLPVTKPISKVDALNIIKLKLGE